MNLQNKYGNIGLELENGLPEYYHVFSNGTLTADIGKTGGVDALGFIDVRYENGMMFPNRWVSHVFNRQNWHMNRPMYGPAVRFISKTGNGTVYHHRPGTGRILPFGLMTSVSEPDMGNSRFDLYLDRDNALRAILQNDTGSFETFEIIISKYHLVSGQYRLRQNQLINHEYGIEILANDQLDESYLKNEPFKDVQGELSWEKISFDIEHNALVFHGIRKFEDGNERPLYMVFGCSEKCKLQESENDWHLTARWNKTAGAAASVALGESLEDLLAQASLSADGAENRFAMLLEDTAAREKNSPAITLSGMSEAADFARILQSRQYAITIDDDKYAAILAASGRYGYFVVWDHNYPIRDFITTGDFATAKKLLLYGIDYPHMKTAPFSVSQLVMEVSELAGFEGNSDFLETVWPKLADEMAFQKHYTHEQTGLLKSTHCCGADNPAEVGLSKFFYASCINAWYYGALRTMENLALSMNDRETARRMRTESDRIAANYLKYFYNEKHGILRIAVNDDLSLPGKEVFHNSSTIGLDYPYGEFLLRRVIRNIAGYKKTKLRSPAGYSAIAYDSESPCEMWRSVYMNQHLGHDTRIARLAGDVKESLRASRHYFTQFGLTKTAIETFNIDGCMDDVCQRTAWQAFSATGAMHCIHQSLAGIAWSRGGLAYLPSEDEDKVEIKNWRFGNAVWHIEIKGKGSFVRSMRLNGQEIKGSMQIPHDIRQNTETLHWEIERSSEAWEKPVLMYFTDVPVENLTETERGIEFTAAVSAHSPVKFYAPGAVVLTVNGNEIPAEYLPEESIVWADLDINKGDKVECVLK